MGGSKGKGSRLPKVGLHPLGGGKRKLEREEKTRERGAYMLHAISRDT